MKQPKSGKWIIWASLLWPVGGVLLAFFDRLLGDALWIAAVYLYLGYVFIGILLFFSIIVLGLKRRSIATGILSVCLLLSAVALYFAEPALSEFGNKTIASYRFSKNRAMYEQIIQRVLSNPSKEDYGEDQGVRYQVDLGPPVRIAFPQPGGLLDNWEGIIYDPTGEVTKATGWTQVEGRQTLTAPENIVRLFGGAIVSCVRVDRDFYLCWFT